MPSWFAERALLPDGPARDVHFDVADGRFVSVTVDASPEDAERLPGVVLPGFANAHSHAFHRALRGRTHDDGGTFWTWRERMYSVASRLDPDSYLALARATYAEMALAGVTAVGEFHYLHHAPGGHPYADPNVMAGALAQAAAEAGIRLTLLDACYLAGGLTPDGHTDLTEVQRRFADRDADAWARRVASLPAGLTAGAAIHSVRAIPRDQLATVVDMSLGMPLHVHLSEQSAENVACQAFYGCSPTALLAEAGVWSANATAVHATHLSEADVSVLGTAGVTACFCLTTERDLADGIGPARDLADAGVSLSLGSDQHAVIDLLSEARALEMDERLARGQRGCFPPSALLEALTQHASIGVPNAGRLQVGARADMVAVRLDTVRTAGIDPAQVVLVAGAADVDTVVVDGRVVVRGGRHRLGDVSMLLRQAIEPLWSSV